MELTFTSEQLKDGSAVRKLIERFQKKNTPENLTALFKVFNYITVIVPVTINEEKSGEIDATSGKREVSFTPDKIKDTEGNLYLPLFTSRDQMKPEYAANFTAAEMSFNQCMAMAEKMKDTKGIIVDFQSNFFVIKKEFFTLIRKLVK